MSLATAPLGTRLRLTRMRVRGSLACRLMEMGLVEGAEVRVVRRAPLGDPMQVRVGDYDLSLRASEARLIGVAAL